MEKVSRGNAAQFYVAGELCRRGYSAVVTMGNCPNTDILCSDVGGRKFVHIQVKTFVPGNKTCSVGLKAEHDYGPRFFWVLAGIPKPESHDSFEYFIIPSRIIAKNVKSAHQRWLKSPGKKGQQRKDSKMRIAPLPPHNNLSGWSIKRYKNRWDLIEAKLEA